MRVLAVDWSGKSTGEAESIWLAEVRDGELTTLANGRGRESVVEHVVGLAEKDPEIIVGLDFAFSFPKWWCDSRGWSDERSVWRAMTREAEGLLAACEYPFWGHPAKPCPHPPQRRFRRTETEDTKTAKSVFQIGGAPKTRPGPASVSPSLSRPGKVPQIRYRRDAAKICDL